ncbi:tetratricopeptide repeat protein [Roseimicrobium sp. ORNL1]|uniref:tetratricopeptide repeat protein n=1 Tax=Roseimicrobium sp. ORNL1 TaxID=2711231 RepID=UPI0013E1E4A8|nr:tetratricopeptide repeat protein [Roseimicrobium sp. ORNL1]QIF03043.1 tetratricopeptide repeat protein [Roseimicrobium sp. ORNL1]
MPPDAARYHQMLLRKTKEGVAFDRFYDAWLATDTPEKLRRFLEHGASSPNAKAGDHLLLALYFSRRGEEEASLKAYTRALELDPDNASAWAERAKLQTRMQDIEGALKSLERGLAAKPEASLLLELSKQRARHLLRLGKNEEALKAFREMVAAQPGDEDLAEEVVFIQMEEGLPEEAAKGTEALISKTKDAYLKVTRLLLLGDIRQKLGNRDEAVNAYEDALDLSGKDTWVEGEVLARIEQSYRREDDLEGLATKLGTLAKADQARVRLSQQHAQVLADLGKADEAIKVYQDLLARTPGQPAVREGFLNLLESAGKLNEAIEQAKALREQLSGDKEWIIRLAILQHRAKTDDSAQATLNEYLSVAGTGESDRLRVARLLETWDLKEPARKSYEALVQAHSDSVSAKEAQAQFLHRIDERDAALAIWRDVAAKGSLEDAIQVGQSLGARMEHEVALEVLTARIATSPGEPRLLAALCTAAAGAKEFAKAIPWARERVRLAHDVTEVEESVKTASLIIRNAGTAEAQSKEIAALPSPTAAERCLQAELREFLKDPAGADAALAALTGPDEALGLQQQVRLLQGRQEWVRAAATMAKLIALPDGRSSSNVQKLVDLHQRAGQSNEALTWISEWKKLSPGAVTPWTTEARLLSDSGRVDDALKVLREAYRKFADNPDLAASFGDQLAAAGQSEEAMDIFENWYEKTEDVTGKMRWASSLARTAAAGGDTAKLVEKFRERQKKNRQSVVPWIALAEIHRASGNSEGRRNAIMEAASLRPQDLELLLELARLQEEDGLWKEALATLETARPLDKGTKIRERQAAIHLRYGDENLGYRIIFELAGGDKMDARGIERLADGIAARGEWERVTEFLEPLLQKHPKDYRLHFMQAVALEESSREREAIQAFIALMQPMEELPGVVVPQGGVFGPQYNTYQEQFMKYLPPGLTNFIELSQTWHMAYRYRQGRGGGSISYSFPGMPASTGFVSVPPYAVSAPSFAAVHLISMAQTLSDTDKNDLVARLKRMDMPQAEMFVHLQWEPQRGGVTVDEAWLQEHLDDEPALAWWVLSLMARSQTGGDSPEALLRKAYDHFHPHYPGIAIQAALAAKGSSTESGKALFAEGIKLAMSLEKMDLLVTQALFFHLQQRGNGGGSMEPSEEESFFAVLKKQVQHADSTFDPYQGWMMASFGKMLADRGRWDDAMEIAQAEQERFEKADSTKRNSANAQMFMSMGPGVVVNPLPFPAEANGVSPAALAVAHPSLPNTMFGPGNDETNPKELPRNEALLKASTKLKNEMLRNLALLAGGDRESFSRYLEARIKAEPENPGIILLAGWEAQQSQDAPKAVQLLQKALGLTLGASQRTMVENAVLHNAMASQTSKDGKPDPAMTAEMLDAVKELARRHGRNTSLNSGQKEYLARAMDALGMVKEATQVRATPKTASTGRSGSSNVPNIGSAQSSPSTVDQLAGKSQRDAAARDAMKQLRMLVPELFTSNAEYVASRAEELLKIVKKHDLAEDILKAANPGDVASLRRKLEYAGLHELLGKDAEAMQLYEAVLVMAPRTTEAQVRMISLLSNKDPEAAARLIAEVKQGTALGGILQNLVQVMQNSGGRGGLSRRIAATRTFTATLEQMAASGTKLPPEISLPYLAMAPRSIGQAHYGNNSDDGSERDPRLPDLYSITLYSGKHRSQEELAGEKSPKGKERRAAHDALCRAMIKVPEFIEDGFASLASLAIAEKQDLTPLRELAADCLKRSADPAVKRRIEAMRMNSFSYSSGGDERLWQPKPVEFLIYAAWKDHAEDRLEKEVYPLLAGETGKETPQLAAAKAFAKLWFGKPEDFAEAADAWVKTDKLRASVGQPAWAWFSDGGHMENLLRFAVEREIAAHLEDWIIGKVKMYLRDNNHLDLDCLNTWMRTLAGQEGTAEVVTFIGKLGDNIFGSAEGRRKAGSDYVAQRYGGSNVQNPKAYSYGQFIEGLMEENGVPAAALQLMISERWLDTPAATQQVRYRITNEGIYDDPAGLVHLLSSTPFGGEAATFRAYGTADRYTPTILGGLLAEMRKRDKIRSQILKQLKEAPNQTFGTALSIACLEPKHDAELIAFVKARKDELSKLGAPAQDELRDVLKQVWPALQRPENMPPDRQEVLRPLFAAEMKSAAERRALVLTATSLEQLKMADRPFFDFLRGEFVKLAAEGKDDEAVNLFEKGCTLIEKKMAAKGWDDGQNWNGWTPRSQLADTILDWRSGWDLVRLGVRLYNTDTSGKLEHPGHPNSNQWNKTLEESWKREGGYWRPDTSLHVTLSRIHSNLKGQNPTILMPVLYDLASQVPPRLRVQLIQWAEGEGAKKPYAALARELAVAARFHRFTSPGKKVVLDASGKRPVDPEAPSMRPEDWDYLLGIMEDASLNPRVRLVIANWICHYGREEVDGRVVLSAMKLSAEGLRNSWGHSAYHLAAALRCFNQEPVNESWKAAADDVWNAWVMRNARNQESSRMGRAYDPADTAVFAMWEMAVRAREKTWQTRLRSDFPNALNDSYITFVAMVRQEDFTEATNFLRTQWKDFTQWIPYFDSLDTVNSDSNIAEGVAVMLNTTTRDKFITACPDPALAELGRIFMDVGNDPPQGYRERFGMPPDYRARRNLAAESFHPEAITDDAMRARATGWLFGASAANEKLAPVVAALAAKVDVSKLGGMNDSQKMRWQILLPLLHSHNLALKGDFKAFDTFYDTIHNHNTWNEWLRDNIKEYSGRMALSRTRLFWRSQPPTKASDMLPITDSILKRYANNDDHQIGDAIGVRTAIYLYDGDNEGLATWRSSLTKEQSSQFLDRFRTQSSLFVTLGDLCGRDPKVRLPLERRLALVEAAVKDEWTQKTAKSNPGASFKMPILTGRTNLLSRPELLEHGMKIAALIPRDGRSFYEMADWFEEEGMADQTLAALDAVIATVGNNQSLLQPALIRKAETLDNMGRNADAMKALEGMDVAKLPTGLRLQVERLQRKEQEAAKKAAASKPESPTPGGNVPVQ